MAGSPGGRSERGRTGAAAREDVGTLLTRSANVPLSWTTAVLAADFERARILKRMQRLKKAARDGGAFNNKRDAAGAQGRREGGGGAVAKVGFRGYFHM